ncbi:uncharacterized protein [Trachinotus anak]|uniref:uncharacterized protein n=1 Tax=Trachinotus anak TaxID=443729 RepID=UPI0039F2152C
MSLEAKQNTHMVGKGGVAPPPKFTEVTPGESRRHLIRKSAWRNTAVGTGLRPGRRRRSEAKHEASRTENPTTGTNSTQLNQTKSAERKGLLSTNKQLEGATSEDGRRREERGGRREERGERREERGALLHMKCRQDRAHPILDGRIDGYMEKSSTCLSTAVSSWIDGRLLKGGKAREQAGEDLKGAGRHCDMERRRHPSSCTALWEVLTTDGAAADETPCVS